MVPAAAWAASPWMRCPCVCWWRTRGCWPGKAQVVVMGNATTHRHGAMKGTGPALAQTDIALKFLPPYIPQLNDIERTCHHESLPQRAFADRADLVLQPYYIVGYSLRSLIWASAVVKRHCTGSEFWLRRRHQAAVSRTNVSVSGMRCRRHCRIRMLFSLAATFSQLACLGVCTHCSFWRMRPAVAGS